MQHCWNANPAQRPSFSEIKTYLEGHLNVSATKTNQSRPDNSEAAAYRPTGEGYQNTPGEPGYENVLMRDGASARQAPRNDYLSLIQEVEPSTPN